jgi:TIGR03009 family protein
MKGVRSVLAATMATLVLLVLQVGAQQPEDLDTVLRAWEKATREVKSLTCVLEREVIDKALSSKQTQKGFAMFLRAKGSEDENRFRYELISVANPKASDKFITAGNMLYLYESATKVVRVFDLAKFKTTVLERISLLSFIFEMDAGQAKERYHLELAGADAHYRFVRVRPKREQDKRDFIEARISLYRTSGLPAQIAYNQPNGSEITWSFLSLRIDTDKIEPRHFHPEVPAGWRLERPSTSK